MNISSDDKLNVILEELWIDDNNHNDENHCNYCKETLGIERERCDACNRIYCASDLTQDCDKYYSVNRNSYEELVECVNCSTDYNNLIVTKEIIKYLIKKDPEAFKEIYKGIKDEKYEKSCVLHGLNGNFTKSAIKKP